MTYGRRRLTLAGLAGAGLLLVSGPALAFWTLGGTGAATAPAGTLSAPSGVVSAPTEDSLTLTFTAPPEMAAAHTRFTATGTSGAGCSTSVGETSCTATGLVAETTYTFTATATLGATAGGWTTPASTAFSGTTLAATPSDTTAPTVTAVGLVNGGGTAGEGLLEEGDAVRLNFSEAMKPSSICSSFVDSGPAAGSLQTISTGSAITVAVSAADVLTVAATNASCSGLAMGAFTLPGDYNPSATSTTYAGNGQGSNTPSTLSYDPTTRTLTVTLGKRSGGPGGANSTALPAGPLTWTASSTGTIGRDLAGNAAGTASVTTAQQRF